VTRPPPRHVRINLRSKDASTARRLADLLRDRWGCDGVGFIEPPDRSDALVYGLLVKAHYDLFSFVWMRTVKKDSAAAADLTDLVRALEHLTMDQVTALETVLALGGETAVKQMLAADANLAEALTPQVAQGTDHKEKASWHHARLKTGRH